MVILATSRVAFETTSSISPPFSLVSSLTSHHNLSLAFSTTFEEREMGYWKTKVLPKIKKVFEKNGPKKAAAAEAVKSFDDSKEEISKEFEEKKTELEPKVLLVYEASSTEIKTLVKERTDAGVKKQSVEVTKFLEELVKIEFPGSKVVGEASTKFGPDLISGPVLFLFEKVSTLLPVEVAAPAPAAEETAAAPVEASTRDIVVEEAEKKEEEAAETEEVTPPAAEEPAVAAPAPVSVETAEPAAAKPVEAEEPPKP